MWENVPAICVAISHMQPWKSFIFIEGMNLPGCQDLSSAALKQCHAVFNLQRLVTGGEQALPR